MGTPEVAKRKGPDPFRNPGLREQVSKGRASGGPVSRMGALFVHERIPALEATEVDDGECGFHDEVLRTKRVLGTSDEAECKESLRKRQPPERRK
jgi:hypothetical protein